MKEKLEKNYAAADHSDNSRKIIRIPVLFIVLFSLMISGCADSANTARGKASDSGFNYIGDYEVQIPTMINTGLKEDYDDIVYLNHSFDKKSGLLKEMELGGELMGACEFRHDSDGRLISENYGSAVTIHISYNDQGLPDAYAYELNEDGYVTKASAINKKFIDTFNDDYRTFTRTFKNHENGTIESYTELKKIKYSDEVKKYNCSVKYDIYGDILSIKGSNGTRIFTYIPYVDRKYSPKDKAELTPSTEWQPFDECRMIPKPDSCINVIKRDTATSDDCYSYLVPGKSDLQIRNQLTIGYYDFHFGAYCSKPEGSDEIYYEYLSILKDVCGMSLTVDDNGNTLISDQKGNRIGVLCYKQVKGKGSCLEIKFI